jgi:hypothetical protein
MAQTAHAHHCRDSPQHGYQRHRPEQTDLYQIVAAYWHKFLERAEHEGGLPDFVKREFDAFSGATRPWLKLKPLFVVFANVTAFVGSNARKAPVATPRLFHHGIARTVPRLSGSKPSATLKTTQNNPKTTRPGLTEKGSSLV